MLKSNKSKWVAVVFFIGCVSPVIGASPTLDDTARDNAFTRVARRSVAPDVIDVKENIARYVLAPILLLFGKSSAATAAVIYADSIHPFGTSRIGASQNSSR